MGEDPWSGRRLHFIGIGGAGMSGLALVAAALGAKVSGSDRAESPYLAELRGAGIEPSIGHDAANVSGEEEVVVSTAIPPENPELGAATAASARVLHRGELLAEVAALKRCVAIAGTHGKTTTASMAVHVLVALGREPSYLVGGELRSSGTNAGWGRGDWLVVEADESDRSFLKLRPELAVITNVELDHHATYRSLAEVERAFAEFARSARHALSWTEVEHIAAGRTFGIDSGDIAAREVELTPGGSRFEVEGAHVELRVPGRHNILNALAALGACAAAGVGSTEAAGALASFTGARRRFELRGHTPTGAAVYDDYAHHPSEVQATIEAARTLAPRRLVACFQPHLYSRTERLARQLGRALALADVVVTLDVYAARERSEDHPGVSGLAVARAAADAAGGRRVYWAPHLDDAQRLLETLLEEGDLLLTLGAGDVDRLASSLTDEQASGPRV